MAKTSSCVAVFALLLVAQVSSVLSAKKQAVGASKQAAASTTACKKYELLLTKLESCPDSGVTFKDFNVTLTDDCKVIPSGCVTSKAFKTAKVKWDFTSTARATIGKDLAGEADGCQEMTKVPDKILAVMQAMKLSTSCPMPGGESCASGNQAVDIKKYKDFMWMATGTTAGKIHVDYDVGSACVDFELTLRNKNGRVPKTNKEIKEAKNKLKNMMSAFSGK